jgi:N6-adenosine-specific RNA methylase IME4
MNSPAVPHQQINDNHQVALTAATLEAWGGKSVTWGKKHAGHKSRMFAKGYYIGHSGSFAGR